MIDIISYAKNVLKMNLFDYEEKQLNNFDEYVKTTEFFEWVRPTTRRIQRTYDIWLSYQEHIGNPVEMIVRPNYV